MLLRLTEAPFRNKKSQRAPFGWQTSARQPRWTSVLPIVRPHSRKNFLCFNCALLYLYAFLHLGMNGLSALYGYNKMAVVHLTHKPEYLIVLRGYFLCCVPCIARMLRPALFHKFYALLSLILWVFSPLKKTHTCRADLVFLDIHEQKSSFPVTAGTIRSYNVSDLSHKEHHSDRLAGHLTHFRLRTYSEGSTVDIWLFKRQTPLLRIYVTAYLRNIQPLGGYIFRICLRLVMYSIR